MPSTTPCLIGSQPILFIFFTVATLTRRPRCRVANYTQAFTLTVRYGEHDRLLANANCQPHGSEGMTDLPMR